MFWSLMCVGDPGYTDRRYEEGTNYSIKSLTESPFTDNVRLGSPLTDSEDE